MSGNVYPDSGCDAIPQVIVEYPGPGREGEQDVFLLLRPETNNYKIESYLLSVFRSSKAYNTTLWMKYLANLPGKFIVGTQMLQQHYETRLFFARHGAKKITAKMRFDFERFFLKKMGACEVIGAFEAPQRLGLSPWELFRESVRKKRRLKTNGQDITEIRDADGNCVYVINGDLPALINRDYGRENCAVVMLRTTLEYEDFNTFIEKIYSILLQENMLPEHADAEEEYSEGSKKVFHYSKGPFEQIRDANEFLRTPTGEKIPMHELTFVRYLESRDVPIDSLKKFLRNPLGRFTLSNRNTKEPETREDSIFELTLGSTYEEAYDIWRAMREQKITYEKENLY